MQGKKKICAIFTTVILFLSGFIYVTHSTNFHFPEKAVMLFMETEIDDYAMTNKCD